MKRSSYSQSVLVVFLVFFWTACQSRVDISTLNTTPASPAVTILDRRVYTVHQRLVLVNDGPGQPEKQNIWVALIRSLPPYQDVLSMEITPVEYRLVIDEYANQYAEFDFSDHPPGTAKTIQIEYQIAVNELAYDLSRCEGQLPDEFTQPELHIESKNPQIISLANDLSVGKKSPCQEVRAFYDYIGNHLVYSRNENDWGAQAALGAMGADCTEYAALLVALSRARGIPARYFEGLLYPQNETVTLARLEHAWADVFMPGAGWISLDPTLGRSSIYREKYFAHHTPEHIVVTLGANPSTLRGSKYWTHLYWPGNSTKIRVVGEWEIKSIED